MLKELDEALRKEVIRHYNALPESQRIDLRQTFIQQRELLRSLLCDYIDRLRAEWPNHKKKRERIIDPIILVKIKFQRLYRYQQPEQPKQPDPNNELVDNGLSILSRIYNEEEVEKEEKEVGEVMLTSSDN
uniref:Uncharacterized protein n=1 Tax=Rhizophagus irregularis (strain DAOM 181602 / DAOM 197198 / MUCL 43194) TaxID=747089 RepID=U9SSH2_RHIID